MLDPEQMTHDEKLATIFGMDGAAPVGAKWAMEFEPRYRPYPSAILAWYFAIATLIVFPAALIAVPLAVRAGRRGNRLAWLAAVLAIVAFIANLAMITAALR